MVCCQAIIERHKELLLRSRHSLWWRAFNPGCHWLKILLFWNSAEISNCKLTLNQVQMSCLLLLLLLPTCRHPHTSAAGWFVCNQTETAAGSRFFFFPCSYFLLCFSPSRQRWHTGSSFRQTHIHPCYFFRSLSSCFFVSRSFLLRCHSHKELPAVTLINHPGGFQLHPSIYLLITSPLPSSPCFATSLQPCNTLPFYLPPPPFHTLLIPSPPLPLGHDLLSFLPPSPHPPVRLHMVHRSLLFIFGFIYMKTFWTCS